MKNLLMACVLITLAFATAAAQQAANQFEIIPIRNNVYMLAGDGGNIALSVGPDGVLVVRAAKLSRGKRVLSVLLRGGKIKGRTEDWLRLTRGET